jgi:D-alanine-D-alanine ligase-like ATP-grasp enzyme
MKRGWALSLKKNNGSSNKILGIKYKYSKMSTLSTLRKYFRKYRLDSEAKKGGAKVEQPSLKSKLLEEAAIERGLTVKRITPRIVMVDLTGNGHFVSFNQMNGPSSSVVNRELLDNKMAHRAILAANGISVAKSKAFFYSQREEAFKFAESLSFPVVVKPMGLSRSRGVTLNINDRKSFDTAFTNAAIISEGINPELIVEKQFMGKVYRLIIMGDEVLLAQLQERANVVGDGKSTILEIINRKNEIRKENWYIKGKEIPTDISKLNTLVANNISLDYVPKLNEHLYLINENYPEKGGEIVVLTEKAHESFKQIAFKAVKLIPQLMYAGVDLLTPDISQEATPDNYIVGELEYAPGPSANYATEGERVNLAAHILDYYIKNKEKYTG